MALLFLTVACSAEPRAQTDAPDAPTPLAITVDDLPAHGPLPPGVSRLDVARDMIAALKARAAPATGFVNGAFGADDPESPKVLAAWRAAGLPVGNHTYGHVRIDDVGVAAFLADVDRNAPFVAGGVKLLRYPYLAEGREPALRDAVRDGLAQRGYRIAAVTLSFDDYAYNDAYARCLAQGDAAGVAALEQRFLASARADAARGRAISRAMLGREVPQILLLHIGAFTTRMLPRLLDQYRAMNFAFVPLEQAQADSFYAATDPAKPGPSPTLDPLAAGMTVPPPAKLPIPGGEVCAAK